MSFDKDAFLKENVLNKKPFSLKKGLFATELTVKENDSLHIALTANGVTAVEDTSKVIISEEDYQNSVYLRVSLGLVDEKGKKVFTKEEIESLKDKNFVDQANTEILELNSPKK